MARTFGKLLCSTWGDDDFLALPSDAKVLYWAFISQPDITAAGVLPLTERRWRRWLNADADAVERAFQALLDGDFIMADEATAEVWVRSFIKHDGRLDNANLAKSVHSSLVDIRSETIKSACRRTLDALDNKTPGGRALEGRSDAVPTPMPREVELLEPAASTINHEPAASSQHRADELPAGFNAVIDAMVGLRLQSERNIRHPVRYRARLEANLPIEHGETITRLLAQFPDAPVSCVAAAALTGDTRQLAQWSAA